MLADASTIVGLRESRGTLVSQLGLDGGDMGVHRTRVEALGFAGAVIPQHTPVHCRGYGMDKASATALDSCVDDDAVTRFQGDFE
jgi:hypothetical protein